MLGLGKLLKRFLGLLPVTGVRDWELTMLILYRKLRTTKRKENGKTDSKTIVGLCLGPCDYNGVGDRSRS